eukprot:jgi/Bigna1/74028/fgenesh1_pg.27_\
MRFCLATIRICLPHPNVRVLIRAPGNERNWNTAALPYNKYRLTGFGGIRMMATLDMPNNKTWRRYSSLFHACIEGGSVGRSGWLRRVRIENRRACSFLGGGAVGTDPRDYGRFDDIDVSSDSEEEAMRQVPKTREVVVSQGPLGIGFKGTITISVRPASQAARLGIQPGWKLIEVGNKFVDSAEDLERAMQERNRSGKRSYKLTFTLPPSNFVEAIHTGVKQYQSRSVSSGGKEKGFAGAGWNEAAAHGVHSQLGNDTFLVEEKPPPRIYTDKEEQEFKSAIRGLLHSPGLLTTLMTRMGYSPEEITESMGDDVKAQTFFQRLKENRHYLKFLNSAEMYENFEKAKFFHDTPYPISALKACYVVSHTFIEGGGGGGGGGGGLQEGKEQRHRQDRVNEEEMKNSNKKHQLYLVADPQRAMGIYTGSNLTPAALALLHWAYKQPKQFWAGKRVLELGSGAVGVVGMALAHLGAKVVMTDVKVLLPLLKYNVDLNRPLLGDRAPQVCELHWLRYCHRELNYLLGDNHPLAGEHQLPEVYIASDILPSASSKGAASSKKGGVDDERTAHATFLEHASILFRSLKIDQISGEICGNMFPKAFAYSPEHLPTNANDVAIHKLIPKKPKLMVDPQLFD